MESCSKVIFKWQDVQTCPKRPQPVAQSPTIGAGYLNPKPSTHTAIDAYKILTYFLPRGLLLTAHTIVQVKEPRSQVTKKFFQP